MRFIDQFRVLLLDLNGTVMFNSDRLSETERFGLTYRQLGGHTLNDDEVQGLILAVVDMMGKIYANPRASEYFPSLRSCVRHLDQQRCTRR